LEIAILKDGGFIFQNLTCIKRLVLAECYSVYFFWLRPVAVINNRHGRDKEVFFMPDTDYGLVIFNRFRFLKSPS